MEQAIALRGVTKTYGPKVAVRDLDLEVPRGAIYGLIGPNGAGKTTTIRMVMSIVFPDRGEISVLGHGSALEAKERIGYLPEERGVYKKMKVGAFLRYMARLKGRSGPGLAALVSEWLAKLQLPGVEGKKCEELSKGMQQKVQFIAAVIHEPDLLILDEPFSGLDPVNMRLLRELIEAEHRRGATIIFSTHVMFQAEQLCDHIVMINDGQKVLDDSLAGIRSKADPRALLFEPLRPQADPGVVRALSAVEGVSTEDGAWEITLREGTDVARAMYDIVGAVPAGRVELKRPTLEDVFVQIVTGATGASTDAARELRAQLQPGQAKAGAA